MKHAIPEAILQQHVAFLGKTGSGKTSTAKLAVEQIVRGNPAARICVLDPIKSDWWGLTSSADGKRPGLPFHILGGPRGHVALHDSAGKAIGELVASGALPLSIIDMADFNAGGLQKFFNDFAPALMKKMRGVVYLVIEEAHEFAPKERSGIGAESMAIHFAKKLATAGRSKGIRLMVITQRTQALHNALLGSCDTMIAHRLTAPADQEPVKKWLKANVSKEIFEKVSSSLSSLKTGSGWICSGEAQVADLVQFPKITTYDNSATPTGDMADLDIKTAPVDRDKLRSIIGDAVVQAEADDPTKLRATIATLTADKARLERQAQTAAAAPTPVDGRAIADADAAGFERGRIAGWDSAVELTNQHIRGVQIATANLVVETEAFADRHLNILRTLSSGKAFVVPEKPSGSLSTPAKAATTPNPAHVAAPPARHPSPAASGDGSNSTAMTKALTAMVELASLGVSSPKREMIAAMAGYSNIQSRPIRESFAQMLSCGWATSGEAGRLSLTEIGRSQVAVPPMPLSTSDMRDRITRAIGSAAGKVLDSLIAAYPAQRTREALAEACGYSNIQSRPIREAFSKLLDMGFVTAPSAGALKAGEALFP